MQNKSPLQVKSVPSVCSRLPSLLATSLRTWVSFPCPWSYTRLLGIHKSIPSPVFCPAWLVALWPALATSFFGVTPQFMGPASPPPRTPALSAIPVSALPPRLVPMGGPGRTPMLLPSIFLTLPRLASDNCSLPFLLFSICMLYNTLCLRFWVHKIEINLEHLSQRIWRKIEPNSSWKELRIMFGHKRKYLINEWEKKKKQTKLDPPGWEEGWEGEILTSWPLPFPSLPPWKVQNSWDSTVTVWKPRVFSTRIRHFV